MNISNPVCFSNLCIVHTLPCNLVAGANCLGTGGKKMISCSDIRIPGRGRMYVQTLFLFNCNIGDMVFGDRIMCCVEGRERFETQMELQGVSIKNA